MSGLPDITGLEMRGRSRRRRLKHERILQLPSPGTGALALSEMLSNLLQRLCGYPQRRSLRQSGYAILPQL
jgi:hypothetical protein